MGETKVRLDIVDMFYALKFHLNESYTIMEGEKVFFTAKEINKLYDLPNDSEVYPDQRLIADPRERDANKVIKLIAWPRAT